MFEKSTISESDFARNISLDDSLESHNKTKLTLNIVTEMFCVLFGYVSKIEWNLKTCLLKDIGFDLQI